MRVSLALLLLLAGAPLAAQEASAYVPLSWWGTPFIEHLIARRRLVDPTPLTRPFRATDLLRTLDAVDSTVVTSTEWTVVRQMRSDLRRTQRGPSARLDVHAGVAASSHARRDPLRAAGPGHTTFSGGAALTLYFGPAVVVSHPYFDTRLKWDPDWYGKKDRIIAGKESEAYVSAQFPMAELFFGILDRNWGPSPVQGQLLSDSPYGPDHLGITLGTSGVRLDGIAMQLNSLTDTAGVHNRYLILHRLWVRPPGRWTFDVWDGTVLEGVGRQLEPWYLNLVGLGYLTQINTGANVNSFVGFDVQRQGAVTVFAQGMLDDIQVDRKTAFDLKPSSYGLTLGAQGALPRFNGAWTLFYTRVTNLTYRNEDNFATPIRFGLGTGRNFSDYDQATLRLSLMAPSILLTPELTFLRQGEGDPRLPHPLVSAYPSTPTIFAGVVERTLRLALAGQVARGRWLLSGDGGVHLISNAGHVSGASQTRWVGTVRLEWRTKKVSQIP
jgi:hypothetical protein